MRCGTKPALTIAHACLLEPPGGWWVVEEEGEDDFDDDREYSMRK
jgi:hypothetical protein